MPVEYAEPDHPIDWSLQILRKKWREIGDTPGGVILLKAGYAHNIIIHVLFKGAVSACN